MHSPGLFCKKKDSFFTEPFSSGRAVVPLLFGLHGHSPQKRILNLYGCPLFSMAEKSSFLKGGAFMKGFIRKVACLVLAFTMIMSVNAFAIGPAGVKDCIKDKDKAIILVGDSRVMHMALNGNVSHITSYTATGSGYSILLRIRATC